MTLFRVGKGIRHGTRDGVGFKSVPPQKAEVKTRKVLSVLSGFVFLAARNPL